MRLVEDLRGKHLLELDYRRFYLSDWILMKRYSASECTLLASFNPTIFSFQSYIADSRASITWTASFFHNTTNVFNIPDTEPTA